MALILAHDPREGPARVPAFSLSAFRQGTDHTRAELRKLPVDDVTHKVTYA
ncbi:hypothetical protein ACFW5X_24615 [Streptomyces albogriseolus]|uniref:hypothetical protein n=1 Tax=Streptomyces albogriseolus TaxID=1887 RepID=UPI00369560E1